MRATAGYVEALMADFDKHSREYDAAAVTDRHDDNCPACVRGHMHTNAEHDKALLRGRPANKR
jgi:hypothetical protein